MTNYRQQPEYNIKRLSSDNLADVEKLHAAVYDRVAAPGFFSKKYDTAFTGVSYMGFIACNNQQEPIAFYGVIPCFIQFADKIILAAQSADTMTHPQYRNKGLFVELALLTYQLCSSNGIQLVFGFPNQNSLPGFLNKLGWKMTGTMDCFIIPASTWSWGRILHKFSPLKNLYGRYQHRILKKSILAQQGMENSVLTDNFAGVYRDYQYLKYKTYTHTYTVKIGNATLWLKINNVLLIGDMAVDPAEFDVMITHLKKLASGLGIKEIHFHASQGTTLHALFTRDFRSIPSFPVIFKDMEGNIQADNIKFTSADIDTF